jgi:ribosomal protein S18 acetylase RimI-like enzyme
VQFVHDVFEQNIEILHGSLITIVEWKKYIFGEYADPYEQHYIILADEKPAAWLKLNGLNSNNICISMLVVDDKFKRQGIGSYAVRFTEEYAVINNKKAIRIQTTKDNLAATHFYLKQGYQILKTINYAVGDGILRDGYEFFKRIQPIK